MICLFLIIPKCRKFDEQVLFQLAIARTMNTICEYYIVYYIINQHFIVINVIYTVYMQTDFVLLMWMFVFSKNLYDKVVNVFSIEKPTMFIRFVVIWTVSIPIGLLCPFLINIRKFRLYYEVYAHVKLFIIIVNSLFFFKIFYVAITKANGTRNVRDIVKFAIIAFILICISSLQVFLTDILSFYYYKYMTLINIFCVMNSYQVVAFGVIFLNLASSNTNKSLVKSVSIKLSDLVKRP